MLDREASQAAARLVCALFSVKPLVDALGAPVRVAPRADRRTTTQFVDGSEKGHLSVSQLLEFVAARAGAPRLTLCSSAADLTVFEDVISNRVAIEQYLEPAARIPSSALSELGEVVERAARAGFQRRFNCSALVSVDGARLRVYWAGSPQNRPVVLVPACGMPAQLCEQWISFLEKDHFVITWETRGLFEEADDFDALGYDVAAQAEDLFAVMDHFDVKVAHLMGLCGGAVIALKAAAARPARVSSISLWHGDLELGPDCPTSTHQDNLKALLSLAGAGRSQAASIHKLLGRSILTSSRADLAHLVLYPYANPELLYRYGRLNGAIMDTDISQVFGDVAHPTLVVTSDGDTMAHPAGSRRTAEKLRNAVLYIKPEGDHLSLFDTNPEVSELVMRFILGESLSIATSRVPRLFNGQKSARYTAS